MRLPTLQEIEAFTDYDALAAAFWQPIPAFDPDARFRIRRMAERMAEMRPRIQRDYLPATVQPKQPDPEPQEAPEQPTEPPPSPPPKAKPKPAPPPPPDTDYFKSLFSKP